MRFSKLKGKMVEKGYTQSKLACSIGITVQSLNAKLNCRCQFTLEEVIKITNLLDIEDPKEYFFSTAVPKMQQNVANT